MTTFESSVKAIAQAQTVVYSTLENLKNLEGYAGKIDDDRIKDLRVTEDTIFIKVDMLGEVGLKLIEKEPEKTLKFEGVNAPITLNFWIQLKEVAESDTRMKLTLKAELPMMVKTMASKPIKEFLEKLATTLASLPYAG